MEPNWRLEEFFVVDQHQTAMEFDQTPRHPVTASAKSSEDIQKLSDKITHNKAAALLRMLKLAVGEYYFQEPLKNYLNSFKYVRVLAKIARHIRW